MASTIYSSWNGLLDEKEGLALRLLDVLGEESSALVANDIQIIRKISEKKSALLKDLAELQVKITEYCKKNLDELHLDQKGGLRSLFEHLATEESRTLHRRRESLERLTRKIIKVNAFNQDCLSTYLDQVRLTRNIISSVVCLDQTYNARGLKNAEHHSGSLLKRSF